MGEDGAVGCENAGVVSLVFWVWVWGSYIMVVISGGERLSSRRSLSASASSILISGRPGIIVGGCVEVGIWCWSSLRQGCLYRCGGVQEQSSGKKKQLSR